MNNPYEKNGLIFWNEEEINMRKAVESVILLSLKSNLSTQNSAFQYLQVEAPILTPKEFVNNNYSSDDMFFASEELVLRPETTMGSYLAAKEILNPHNERKVKLPLVVWQHGKSFRKEQDQPTKFMRLKEFYQLEFQILYSATTAKDYSVSLIPELASSVSTFVGECIVEPSDRVPDYSESTYDIIVKSNGMEICSISKRKDFEHGRCLEVAFGTDRIVYNNMLLRNTIRNNMEK